MDSIQPYPTRTIRKNYLLNVLDGGFFGFALGIASFSTVIPLFISTMTDSAILIGLIPAVHTVGWQLPQLFTARRIASLPRLKPLTLLLTIHERVPFLGLAAIAWFLPSLKVEVALVGAFFFLIWQGLGGGFTANPWQNLIGRIIPNDIRALFFGFQSAAANLLASVGAILSGLILERYDSPLDYTICFLSAVTLMFISWLFVSQVREEPYPVVPFQESSVQFWEQVSSILARDRLFRWFLSSRMVAQFALMAFSFYTVYAVRQLGMSEGTAGIMTGVWLITQVAANPLLGWLADRWSHRRVLEIGAIAATLSAFVAWLAPHVYWFFLANFLAGIASMVFWTIGLSTSLKFGSESERPIYVGLANTLIAPFTILAPIVGGWLADHKSYPATFLFACLAGIITTLIFHIFFIEPKSPNAGFPSNLPENSGLSK